MKKIYKAVVIIALLSMLTGCSLIKKIVAGDVADGGGMVNYNGYFEALYNGEWTSGIQRLSISISFRFRRTALETEKLQCKERRYECAYGYLSR